MPANLQGLWGDEIQTPWNGDYHLDINVQMNYWLAEIANLSECHMPMLELIESLQEPGRRTARAYYGAKGWVTHVISNVWGLTSPGSWARLKDGDKAYWHIKHILTSYCRPNLFTIVYGGGPFQIEANLGSTASIAEMLMQSHDGVIQLLPALPEAWPDGEVKGLCARGGYEVDLVWRQGSLERVTLRAKVKGKMDLRYGDKSKIVSLKKGSYLS